jgi:hypothetical protein
MSKAIIGGIQIFRSSMLPANTILVSDDIYELLNSTPEERQAKARALRDKCDELTRMIDKITNSKVGF